MRGETTIEAVEQLGIYYFHPLSNNVDISLHGLFSSRLAGSWFILLQWV